MSYKLCLKDILKAKISELGIGVPTLAKNTGISRQTIANWMDGQRPRNIEQVKAVADYLGLTVDEICFGPHVGVKRKAEIDIETYFEDIHAGVFEVILRRSK